MPFIDPDTQQTPSKGFVDPDQKDSVLTEAAKNAFGGIESVGRMMWNVPAGATAQALGTARGLLSGGGIEGGIAEGRRYADAVHVGPFTEAGKVADEALGEGYDYLKRGYGQLTAGRHRYDPNAPAGSTAADPRNEAALSSFGEGMFDAMAMLGPAKGVVMAPKTLAQRIRERKEKRDKGDAAEPKTKLQRELLGGIEYKPTTEPVSFELGIGKGAKSTKAPKAQPGYLRERDTIYPDNQTNPYARAPDFFDQNIPQSLNIERTRTGREMLEEPRPMQREFTIPQPEMEPLPGRARPEQLELPLLRESALERQAREEGLAWNERAQEAPTVSREQAFRDMEARRAEMEQADAIRRQTDFQFEPEGNYPMPSQRGPILPRNQRGAINPEVFVEGFRKIKDVTEKGLRLVAKSNDQHGRKLLEITAFDPKTKQAVGYVSFEPTQRGLEPVIEPANTFVKSEFRRRGIATEMARFAEEMGNDIARSNIETPSGKGFWSNRQRGAFNPEVFTEGLEKLLSKAKTLGDNRSRQQIKNINKTDNDLLQDSRGTSRSFEEFLRDMGGKLEDIPEGFGTAFVTGERVLGDPNSLYNALKSSKDGQKAAATIEWLHERINDASYKRNLVADIAKEEVRFKQIPIFGSKKIVNPDSMRARYDAASTKVRDEAAQIANELSKNRITPNRGTLLSQGHRQQAVDLALKIHERHSIMLDWVNGIRERAGKGPIRRLEGYFAMDHGHGPYVVRVREKGADPKADSLMSYRTMTSFGANRIKKGFLEDLEKQGIVDVIATVDHDPHYRSKGSEFNVAPGAINDLIASMERGDPRREVIRGVWEQTKGKAAAGGHTIHRRDVGGGDLTGKNILEISERYIDQMASYGRNLELSILRKELQSPDMLPSNSRLSQWADQFITAMEGQRTGGKYLNLVEDAVDTFTGAQYAGGVRTIQNKLNKAFLTATLMIQNPTFGWASWLQGPAVISGSLKMYKDLHNIKSSPTEAIVTATVDMVNPSRDQARFLEWMAGRGTLDPTFTSELGKFGSKWVDRAIDYPGLAIIPKSGERFGKTLASLAGYNLLYESGMRGKELWTQAERISKMTMADYTNTGRPGIVRDTGIFGEGIKPLTTYYNWYLGTMATALKLAGKGKPGSLVALVGVQTILAGFLAAPLVKDLDKIWNMFRSVPGIDKELKDLGMDKSLTQLMTERMPDGAAFGVIDGLTTNINPQGIRLGAGMTSPEVHLPGDNPFLTFAQAIAPGATYGKDLFQGLYNEIRNAIGGDVTSAELKKSRKAVVPSKVGDAWLEYLDSRDGLYRSGPRSQGGVEKDSFAERVGLAGASTLKESRDRIGNQELNKEKAVRKEKGTRLVELIVDSLENKNLETSDARVQKLIEQALESGIDARSLNDRIIASERRRNTARQDREVGRGRTRLQQELLESIDAREDARRREQLD